MSSTSHRHLLNLLTGRLPLIQQQQQQQQQQQGASSTGWTPLAFSGHSSHFVWMFLPDCKRRWTTSSLVVRIVWSWCQVLLLSVAVLSADDDDDGDDDAGDDVRTRCLGDDDDDVLLRWTISKRRMNTGGEQREATGTAFPSASAAATTAAAAVAVPADHRISTSSSSSSSFSVLSSSSSLWHLGKASMPSSPSSPMTGVRSAYDLRLRSPTLFRPPLSPLEQAVGSRVGYSSFEHLVSPGSLMSMPTFAPGFYARLPRPRPGYSPSGLQQQSYLPPTDTEPFAQSSLVQISQLPPLPMQYSAFLGPLSSSSSLGGDSIAVRHPMNIQQQQSPSHRMTSFGGLDPFQRSSSRGGALRSSVQLHCREGEEGPETSSIQSSGGIIVLPLPPPQPPLPKSIAYFSPPLTSSFPHHQVTVRRPPPPPPPPPGEAAWTMSSTSRSSSGRRSGGAAGTAVSASGRPSGEAQSHRHRNQSTNLSSSPSGLRDIYLPPPPLPLPPQPPPPLPPPPPLTFGAASSLQQQQPHYPPHFARGSIIQLGSGRLKKVEELQTRDFVDSARVAGNLRIDSSTVTHMRHNHERNTVILGFSVGQQNIQVTVEATLEHPFFVYNQGWSSYSPELTLHRYGLGCRQLNVGNCCISLTQRDLRTSSPEHLPRGAPSFDPPSSTADDERAGRSPPGSLGPPLRRRVSHSMGAPPSSGDSRTGGGSGETKTVSGVGRTLRGASEEWGGAERHSSGLAAAAAAAAAHSSLASARRPSGHVRSAARHADDIGPAAGAASGPSPPPPPPPPPLRGRKRRWSAPDLLQRCHDDELRHLGRLER